MAPSSTWVTTVIIAAELAVGGVWDILRIGYVREILEQQLGYPAYFAVIMGAWKVPGAGAARPALCPAQGVGLRWRGLHLYRSGRLPPGGG